MNFSFVIFCVQISLIQYAFTQRVNGQGMVNNGPQYSSNSGLGSTGQVLGRKGPELGGVTAGPGISQIGLNQGLNPYGQVMPNGQTFNAGIVNNYGKAGIANQGFAGAGIPKQAYGSAGLPNQAFAATGMTNQAFAATGVPNQAFAANGIPNPAYGGSGNGGVTATGELPVSGTTAVTGQVPLTGMVAFNGNVPCGGIVTISGTCTSCGGNVPYGQIPAFGGKPFGY